MRCREDALQQLLPMHQYRLRIGSIITRRIVPNGSEGRATARGFRHRHVGAARGMSSTPHLRCACRAAAAVPAAAVLMHMLMSAVHSVLFVLLVVLVGTMYVVVLQYGSWINLDVQYWDVYTDIIG